MMMPDVNREHRKFYVDLDDNIVWDAMNNHWGHPSQFAGLLGGAVVKKYIIDYDDDRILGGDAGVSIWTPLDGEVLLNLWVDLVEPWNAPAFMSFYPGPPATTSSFQGAQVDLTQTPTTEGNLRDAVLSMGAIPSMVDEAGVDIFTIIISQDGTPTGGAPTATKGKVVVYCETATPLEGEY